MYLSIYIKNNYLYNSLTTIYYKENNLETRRKKYIRFFDNMLTVIDEDIVVEHKL